MIAGGAERDRTADLVNAIHALSQLSYGPIVRLGSRRIGLPARLSMPAREIAQVARRCSPATRRSALRATAARRSPSTGPPMMPVMSEPSSSSSSRKVSSSSAAAGSPPRLRWRPGLLGLGLRRVLGLGGARRHRPASWPACAAAFSSAAAGATAVGAAASRELVDRLADRADDRDRGSDRRSGSRTRGSGRCAWCRARLWWTWVSP